MTSIAVAPPMQRIAIIGPSGAGKSTLARELGARTGLPVIHLDREFWGERWQPTPGDEWARRLAEFVSRDRWIIDGNYGSTMEARLAAADTIVFMDVSTGTSLYRVLKRWVTYRGPHSRPDMADGCPERIDVDFLKWVVWTYPRKRRAGITARVRAQAGKKRVYILRTSAGLRRFLDSLPNNAEAFR
jgi:adenylate kinase family enzyme